MSFDVFLVLLLAGGTAAAILLVRTGRVASAYFKLRGKRLVTCPETRCPAAVEVDAIHAGQEAFLGAPQLRLSACSRWPERRGCGQECLEQIESAPKDCLVRTIVIRWFESKACVFCGKPITETKEWWVGHPPGLVSPGKTPVSWQDLPAEKLPEVFSTLRPVCWSCLMTETFRLKFPELVTDRNPTPLRMKI